MWIIGILAFIGLCAIIGTITPHDSDNDTPSICEG